MPFALLFIGMILVITGFQNTYAAFGQQVQKDFTGQGNFLYWLAALGMAGSVGYLPKLETLSRIFMALIIVAVLVGKNNGNFFSNLTSELNQGSNTSVNPVGTPLPATGGAPSGSSSSGSFNVGNLVTDATAIANIL